MSTNVDIASVIKSIYSSYYGHAINGWEAIPLINMETLQDIGFSIKIDLNSKDFYDVSVLHDWGKSVGADSCTVGIKKNKLVLNFKIYNK